MMISLLQDTWATQGALSQSLYNTRAGTQKDKNRRRGDLRFQLGCFASAPRCTLMYRHFQHPLRTDYRQKSCPESSLASHWTLHDNESRTQAVHCAKTGHAPRCLSTLRGSQDGSPNCFVDSDGVRRHFVLGSQAHRPHLVVILLFGKRHRQLASRAPSADRDREECIARHNFHVGKRHMMGSHAVIDDTTRPTLQLQS